MFRVSFHVQLISMDFFQGVGSQHPSYISRLSLAPKHRQLDNLYDVYIRDRRLWLTFIFGKQNYTQY